MSNDEPTTGQGSTRRPARQGAGGNPVGSTLSIVLAVVAVVAGFLILRNITDDGGSGSSGAVDNGSEEVDDVTSTSNLLPTTTAVTTTTVFQVVTEGATVVVANANTVGGSAGRMSDTLELAGFTMGEPTNATEELEASIVYYDPAAASAQVVAESVAYTMGDVESAEVPNPIPTADGTMGDGQVLVMLGSNEADKTLDEMRPEDEETPATGSAPEPSGGDATTGTEADATEEAPADTAG